MATLMLMPTGAQEAREAETPVQEASTKTQERYAEVTAWCNARFPFREDLQEACKWGAYEMIAPTVPIIPEQPLPFPLERQPQHT